MQIVAADLEVKRKVPDYKTDKLGVVKNPVSEFKVDSLRTVNKSCNNISVKQDKLSVGDGAVILFQMNTNSPEKVPTTCSAKKKALSMADKEDELSVADKEKELSVADKEELSVSAFKGLLSKRDILVLLSWL